MHFVGHFIGTNRADKALRFTRVECIPSAGSRISHVRALDLSSSASEPGRHF
jgi:hypothetical protein